jgi:hypothetical protein
MEIDRRRGLDRETFRREYVEPQRPVLLEDVGAQWPALERWTFDELRARRGDVEVEVEDGDVAFDARPRLRMTLGQYLDLVESGEAERRHLYLALFDILNEVPGAADEVDFSIMGRPPIHYRRAWIGAAGSGSGFHHDIANNILAQVVGEKTVRIASPADTSKFYESDRFDSFTYYSSVDADHWDEARFPAFADADIAEVVLRPGEGLFIPSHWWHYARARTAGISINGGAMTLGEAVREWQHFGLIALHYARLYRRGKCVCHAGARPHPVETASGNAR